MIKKTCRSLMVLGFFIYFKAFWGGGGGGGGTRLLRPHLDWPLGKSKVMSRFCPIRKVPIFAHNFIILRSR